GSVIAQETAVHGAHRGARSGSPIGPRWTRKTTAPAIRGAVCRARSILHRDAPRHLGPDHRAHQSDRIAKEHSLRADRSMAGGRPRLTASAPTRVRLKARPPDPTRPPSRDGWPDSPAARGAATAGRRGLGRTGDRAMTTRRAVPAGRGNGPP